MYLGAFPAVPDQYRFSNTAFRYSGVDPDDCRARGGVPSFVDVPTGLAPNGQPTGVERRYSCTLPATPRRQPQRRSPAAKINVRVPTTVNTQISPSISPVFVQQDNPTNSPVVAAPKHTGAGVGNKTPKGRKTGVTYPPVAPAPVADDGGYVPPTIATPGPGASFNPAPIDSSGAYLPAAGADENALPIPLIAGAFALIGAAIYIARRKKG